MKNQKQNFAGTYPLSSNFLAFSMQQQNIFLAHGGVCNHELNTKIIESVEQRLTLLKERLRVKKRVVNVLMECLGNLANHACSNNDMFFNSTVTLSQTEEDYIIQASNRISKAEKNSLTDKLQKVNSLGNDDLKELYSEVLLRDVRSEKGGAGLGLIDIARKASGKLEYEFTELNDGCSLFTLSINVSRLKS